MTGFLVAIIMLLFITEWLGGAIIVATIAILAMQAKVGDHDAMIALVFLGLTGVMIYVTNRNNEV